jgi:acetolactate decarboxylase
MTERPHLPPVLAFGYASGVRALGLLLCLLLASCAGVKRTDTWDGEVHVQGDLRGMIHEGKTGPVVELDGILPDPTLVAVGALAEMAGEVTVVDGKLTLSYGEGTEARTESPQETSAAAALLVSARVPAWSMATTTQSISFEKLDEAIGKLAVAAGMDLEKRFPFVVEGRVRNLEWHVLGGPPAAGGADSHDAHLEKAAQLRLPSAKATLVGFYSKSDEGVFTHAGKKTHVHCVLAEPVSAGHVDHVIVLPGATVRFPALPAAQGAEAR